MTVFTDQVTALPSTSNVYNGFFEAHAVKHIS